MNQQDDIQKELIELNSKLSVSHRAMPYDVPNSYFEQLPSSIILQTSTKDATTYTAPEGYFDTMPEVILEKVKTEQKKKNSKTIDFSWRKISLAAAAIILLFVSVGIYQLPNEQQLTTAENLALVPDDVILAYVENNIEDFDLELLTSSLPSTSTESSVDQIDNNTINEYLNELY